MFLDEMKSSVVSRRSVVIDHELPALTGNNERSSTHMDQSLRNVDAAFQTRFEAVGVTPDDQERVRRRVPGNRILPDTLIWDMHLNHEAGEIISPESTPTIGFHSYGNVYRWPSNKSIFSEIYISSSYNTRLFGHLEAVREKFGDELFGQVESIDSDQLDESAFLKSIDFWVYCPHHRLKDQVWRPVLSAMNAGKVVILPGHLEPVYGQAAIYADSGDVVEVVRQPSNDANAYRIQTERGQEFVASAYSKGHLSDRIEALMVPIKPASYDNSGR